MFYKQTSPFHSLSCFDLRYLFTSFLVLKQVSRSEEKQRDFILEAIKEKQSNLFYVTVRGKEIDREDIDKIVE
jgi:hypothetical protein